MGGVEREDCGWKVWVEGWGGLRGDGMRMEESEEEWS